MKICDLVQAYNDRSGGIRTYVEAKRCYLADRDSHRHVLVVPGERDAVTRDEAGTIYHVASVPVPFRPPYRLIVDLARVREILRREDPDVIELETPFFLPAAAFQHRRSRPCAVVGYYHTDVPGAYVAPFAHRRFGRRSGDALAALVRHWETDLYNRCDLTLTATRENLDQLRARGISPVQQVPLAVDTEVFHPRARDDRLRSALGIRPDDLLIIYAGRLDQEKRVDLVAEAFGRLRSRWNGRTATVHLAMIGEGPRRAHLRAAANRIGNMSVLAFCSGRAELARHLASADLYVTAGPHETFGLSVAEAQACGLPVVGVRAGALRERVPEAAGFLCAPDSVAELVAALERMVSSDLAAMGRAGRELVVSTLSWERTFEDLLHWYGELHERRAARKRPCAEPCRSRAWYEQERPV